MTISNATICSIRWNGKTNVEKIGTLYPSDFLKRDYTFTGFDTTGIALGTRERIKTDFPNLKEDKFINNSF